MSGTPNPPTKLKPITNTKIPGTEVPDVTRADAESDRQKAWMSRVAVSTAVMAAGAAVSTMFSGGHLNQAMFEQIQTADQWNFYQSKGIKHTVLETRLAVVEALGKTPSDQDVATLARYKKEQGDIEGDAKAHEALAAAHLAKYKLNSRAATALQIGIGLAAVALLLRRNIYWVLALAAGAVGAVFLTLSFI
jgi:hypothetical protein